MMLAPLFRPVSCQLEGDSLEVFTRILEDSVNLVCWRRTLSPSVAGFVDALLGSSSGGRDTATAESSVIEIAPGADPQVTGVLAGYQAFPGYADFVADVNHLTQAFVCLFDVRRAGLRLRVLDHAMCPRWHVDQVPVRLITT
jgi:hypothetical protein